MGQNKQVVHRFFEECWNHGDFQNISEYLTDDVQATDPAFPHMQPKSGFKLADAQELVARQEGFDSW